MRPYYVEYPMGGCTVIYARTIGSARKQGRVIFDRLTMPNVRPANQGDIEGVLAFGGRIHNEPKSKSP